MKMKQLQPGYLLPCSEKASYWSYLVGQNFSYTIATGFLGTYMMMIGVNISKTAALMLFVKVWDAVNDALFGVVFDKIKFKSGNKCLPWIRISSALIPITTIIMFLIPKNSPESLKLIWFTVAYVLWDTAYTVSDVPIYGMVTTMTNNLDERNQLMSFGRIFGGGGGILATMLISILVSEKVGLSFGVTAVIVCVFAMLFMLPVCFKGQERNKPEQVENNYTFKEMFHYIKTNKYLLLIFGSYLIFGCLTTTNALGLFVSYYLFGSATFNTLLVAITAIPMLIIALILPALLKRTDKFKLYFGCLASIAIISFIVYFVGYASAPLYIVLRVFQSIPISMAGVMAFMFTPDCAEYGRYKTGTDARGITFAIQTFSCKITGAVASSLGLFILGMFGWVSIKASSFAEIAQMNIAQPESAIRGLWFTYVLVPGIGVTLALIPLFFYKLRDKDVQIMAKCNSGELTKVQAESMLSRKY